MKKAVIIGAGQTGRGFIAPIVRENGYAITFLDKDRALVEQLRKSPELANTLAALLASAPSGK